MRKSQRSTVRARTQRSVWKDPRFIIGFFLIIASIALVTTMVSQARAGTKTYYATHDISPGEPISSANTAVVEARPGADVYLTVNDELEGRTSLHTIRKGELIPRSAAPTRMDTDLRSFVVTVSDGLPEDVRSGTKLDVWFVPATRIGDEKRQVPEKLRHDVWMVRVLGRSGSIGASAGTRIEVRTTSQGIEQLLSFANGNGSLAAVPVGHK